MLKKNLLAENFSIYLWLPDPLRGMRAWPRTMKFQRSFINMESAKNERHKESVAGENRMRLEGDLDRMSAGAA